MNLVAISQGCLVAGGLLVQHAAPASNLFPVSQKKGKEDPGRGFLCEESSALEPLPPPALFI